MWEDSGGEQSGRPSVLVTATALTALTYTANSIWINLLGYSPAFAIEPATTVQAGRLAFQIICVISALVFMALGTKAVRHGKGISWASLCCAVCGALLLVICQYVPMEVGWVSPVLALLGYAFVGTSYIWTTVTVYVSLWNMSTFSMAVVLLAVAPGSWLLFATIQSFISVTVQTILTPCMGVIACLGAILLKLRVLSPPGETASAQGFLGNRFQDNPAATPQVHPARHRKVLRLLRNAKDNAGYALRSVLDDRQTSIQVVAAAIIIVAAYGLSNIGLWGSSHQRIIPAAISISTLLLAVTFCIVAGISGLAIHLHFSRVRKYNFPFLILLTIYVVILILRFAGVSRFAIDVLSLSTSIYCHILSPFVIVFCLRKLALPALATCSLSNVLIYALALIWTVVLEAARIDISIIMLVLTYLVTLAIAHTVGGQSNTLKPQTNQKDSDGIYGNILERRNALVIDHRLTSRESEILGLLLLGRSTPYIEKKLVLSNGTVRAHVRHIYEKLDVHSKQELLDLTTDD